MSLSIVAAIRLLREDGDDLDLLHEAEAVAAAYIRAHGLDHYRFYTLHHHHRRHHVKQLRHAIQQ